MLKYLESKLAEQNGHTVKLKEYLSIDTNVKRIVKVVFASQAIAKGKGYFIKTEKQKATIEWSRNTCNPYFRKKIAFG